MIGSVPINGNLALFVGRIIAVIQLSLLVALNAYAVPDCDAEFQISETFSNGARWQMCRSSTQRENLILSNISYTSVGKQPFNVFSSVRLAQLHVAYDDSNVTYNDVTDYGLGGEYMSDLRSADCPGGELLLVQNRPGICKMRSSGDDLYRTASETRQAESLTLFSVSQVGSYSYTVTWKFFSDGSVQPSIGAAGALQRSNNEIALPFGRTLEGVPDKSWLSHTHSYYWRLDFDLGDSALDDRAYESNWILDKEGRRRHQLIALDVETARATSPEHMRSWTIKDSNNINEESFPVAGFDIEPLQYGHRYVRENREAYTAYDFFVTKQNDCELFASKNQRFNPGCADNVLEYADGESLQGSDLVAWHRVSFHHLPRNEDRSVMHTHWDGFLVKARNLQDATPGHSGTVENSLPVFTRIPDQSGKVGDVITQDVAASDSDADKLVYADSGIPPGLTLDQVGLITGSPTERGEYQVEITVSDPFGSTRTNFTWTVESKGTVTGGGSGSPSPIGVLLLLMLILLQRKIRVIAGCDFQ